MAQHVTGEEPMNREAASPDQLEREIAHTRAEIGRKLTLLQDRLSPRHVAGRVAGSVGEQGSAFARNLGAALRDNPVPALLLGIGLCWLMLASRHSGHETAVDDLGDAGAALPPAGPASLAPPTATAPAAAEAGRDPAAEVPAGEVVDGTLGVASGRR
jgi:hypothetical protein